MIAESFIAAAVQWARENGATPEAIEGWSEQHIENVCGMPGDKGFDRKAFCAELRAAVAAERHDEIQAEVDTKFQIAEIGAQAVADAAVNDTALADAIVELAKTDASLARAAELVIGKAIPVKPADPKATVK
jgi:hypothetical protein